VLAFYGTNGLRLTMTNDDAYALVMSVARGDWNDIARIASLLEHGAAPR
jgi:death-on-curing protein